MLRLRKLRFSYFVPVPAFKGNVMGWSYYAFGYLQLLAVKQPPIPC